MTPVIRATALRLLYTAVLVVLTFPRYDLVTDVGVDNSLAWAFNHLFATGLEQGAHLIFPHGPLAFLMYPQALGGDLSAALIASVLILGTFLFALLSLGANSDPEQPVRNLLIAALLAVLLQIHMQLVGITAVALVLHWRTGGRGWLATAALATLIALHVRAGVGIMAGTLLAAHGILLLSRRGEWRTMVLTSGAFIVAAVFLRWVLYGSLAGLGTYYQGLFELTRASSAATGLYPHNLWWAIVPAIVVFFSVPLLVRDAPLRHLYALFALTLFAAWKHGITREDVYHARGLFVFVLFFMGLVLLVWDRPRPMVMLAFGAVLVLGQLALSASLIFSEQVFSPFGVVRFHDLAFEQDATSEQARRASLKNLERQVLPPALQQRLAQGTVDVYPWEFSYIPANGLSWQPRPVLQTYASYTPWLDARNAEHFVNGRGADRILWHFVDDRWGGRLGSVDDRYLLNDEPRTIMALLDNYTWTTTTDRAAVLERHEGTRFEPIELFGDTVGGWDVWNRVPEAPDGILRARVQVKGTWKRALKDFVYKDAEYTVVYRLTDGTTRTYRFVPDLAGEGLWVAPFTHHPQQASTAPRVTHLRFHCSTPGMVHEKLPITWELTRMRPVSGEAPPAYSVFGEQWPPYTPVVHSRFDMEQDATQWQFNTAHRTDSMAHSGSYANRLVPTAYSATYVHDLDTLEGPLDVRASAWIRTARTNKLAFAISVEDSTGILFWEAVDANEQAYDHLDWWRASIQRRVQPGPGRLLKVYLYNDGQRTALVDDMEVHLTR